MPLTKQPRKCRKKCKRKKQKIHRTMKPLEKRKKLIQKI
jgi:hypothetical protein